MYNNDDDFSTPQETREQRYDHRQNNNSNQFNTEPPEPSQAPSPKPKRHHWGRWVASIGAIILLFLGIGIYHEFHELNDLQRKQDTLLDSAIKNQAISLAQKKAPTQEKTKIIKIIKNVPLSEMQQAANNQQLFNQLANQYQISQNTINQINQHWFDAQNAQLRSAIEHGNLIDAYQTFNNR